MATLLESVQQLDKRIKSSQNEILDELANLERQVEYLSNTASDIKCDISGVKSEVRGLCGEFSSFRLRFEVFQDTVSDFITKQIRANALNVAHHKKQELEALYERRFSGYRKVRELAGGLLDSSDLATVQKSTFLQTSEQALLQLSDYWLAYCMLAFSHWLNDNSREAYTALGHCLKCDKDRASLFFALVCRQYGRFSAFRNWAIYYLFNQKPDILNENCVIFIDAYANGLLGNFQNDCVYKKFSEWLKQMSQPAQRSAVQMWSKYIRSQYTQCADRERYEALEPFLALQRSCTNFVMFSSPFLYSRANSHVLQDFRQLLTSQSDPDYFDRKLRDIQRHIITEYNSKEKDLLKKIRSCDLIIANDGDEKTASAQLELEFAEKPQETIAFSEMLRRVFDSSLSIETTAAVKVLAVVLSRSLIAQALREFQQEYRSQAKQNFYLKIEDWQTDTYDGSDSSGACDAFKEHMDNKLARAKKQYADTVSGKVNNLILMRNIAAAGAVISFLMLCFGFAAAGSDSAAAGALGLLGCLFTWPAWLIFWLWHSSVVTKWQQQNELLEKQNIEKTTNGKQLLQTCCRQAGIYRKQFDNSEIQARELVDYIDHLTMESTNLGIG